VATIHPTAIVEPGAELAPSVTVDAYAIVRAPVRVGEGTTIGPHCVIDGRTTIGRDNRIFAHAFLGGPPQDKKYGGEETALVIGDRNTIREFTSFHTGTVQDAASGGTTRIGDDNWIMNHVHIAHDCTVGDQTIIAGYAGLAGHVEIGDWAIVGAQSGLHQFVKMGAHAMCGFQSHVSQDVPPFVMIDGNPASVRGVNAEGLRRRGFSAARIAAVRQMHRLLYRDGLTFESAREKVAALAEETPEAADDVRAMVEFLRSATRGIVR
jgi:UDP-N-acetylglucosamine acyltransferase